MKRVGRGSEIEEAITTLAARQHGVVTRSQMIDTGVPAHVIAYRLTQGRLRALHRGVYGWGPLAAPREREMAAVLACGPTAALSRDDAARLWASCAGMRAWALGMPAAAAGREAYAVGKHASAARKDAFAVGKHASAARKDAFAVGKHASAAGVQGGAIGRDTNAPGIHPNEAGMHASVAGMPGAARGRPGFGGAARTLEDTRAIVGAVAVTVVGSARVRGPGIRVYRVRRLDTDETTVLDGIPITTPARTILDVASAVGPSDLERMVAQAEREGLIACSDLARLVARHPRHPGGRIVRGILAQDGGPALTRSEAEARFLAFVRKAGLPAPRVNTRLEGYEVDFLWRAQRLVVEVDGAAYHANARAFERDRLRDGKLMAAGYRVMRVTWRQLSHEHEALLVRLALAIAAESQT